MDRDNHRIKSDGVNGFQDSEKVHTPMAENVKSHVEKREQNTATWQEHLEYAPRIVNYPPAGGRMSIKEGVYKPSKTDGMQHSREGNRIYSGSQTHGKVEVAGNHPNKSLNQLYG